MTKTLNTEEIEQRVRHTLSTVAATLTEDAVGSSTWSRGPRRSKRRWCIGLGIGVVAVPLVLAVAGRPWVALPLVTAPLALVRLRALAAYVVARGS